jgi:MraZ protein
MFLGEHRHSLDDKGRVILPSRFRTELAGGAFVTREVDGCLSVMPTPQFEVRAREVQEMAGVGAAQRDAARVFFSGTADGTPDKQGRVVIPQHLRDFAGLEREVVITGQFDRIEIWDASAWQVHKRTGEAVLVAGATGTAPTPKGDPSS